MRNFLFDLRYAARLLRRSPGYAVTAIVTLALGLGANTAIFSVVHGVVYSPLPYEEPQDLVRLYGTQLEQGVERAGISQADFYDYRERLESVDVAAYTWYGLSLTSSGRPRELTTIRLTPGFLDMLGVEPLLGRTFLPEEEEPGEDRVVVLGHGFWQRELGGAEDIVGRTLELDEEPWTVVGVMPEGFGFPEQDVELWVPATRPEEPQRNGRGLMVLGRLASGSSLSAARDEVRALASALETEYPDTNDGWSARVDSFHERVVGDVRPALLALLGAVGLVLLVACANVANLTLSRNLARRREIAVRSALGAGRAGLVRLLLAESLLVALAGGLVGLALAAWGVDLLVALSPVELPRVEAISLDGQVLLFAAAVTLFAGPLVALLLAWQLLRNESVQTELRGSGRSVAQRRTDSRIRGGLTVVEVALSLMLLMGAGLMARSFMELARVDPGFRSDGVAAAQIFAYGPRYPSAEEQGQLVDRVLEEIRAQPGVEAAGVTSMLPLSVIRGGVLPVRVQGRAEAEKKMALAPLVTPGYFDALEIPLLRGRRFTDGDRDGGTPVALLNRPAAELYFPGEDPLGRQLQLGSATGDDAVSWTVVGVVEGVRGESLEAEAEPAVYRPLAQTGTGTLTFVARTATGDAPALAEAIQEAIWQQDSLQPIFRAFPMSQLVESSAAGRSFYTGLVGLFALLALVLAAVGLYGLMAYSVTRRTRELGVRMAIGAEGRDIRRLVMSQGLRLVLLGLGLGLVGGLALAQLLEDFLFAVEPFDPLTFLAVAGVLIAVAGVACWLPAWRASRLDPTLALARD